MKKVPLLLIATLLAVALPACQRAEAPAATSVRLIPLTKKANVKFRVRGRARRAKTKELRRSQLAQPKLKKHIGRVALHGSAEAPEERLSLIGPTNVVFRYEVEVPTKAVLHFGAGAWPGKEGLEETVRFRVRMGSVKEPNEIVFDQTTHVTAENQWLDAEVDLGSWGGRRVVLSLETKVVTKQSSRKSTSWVAWSSPEIRSSGRQEDGWDLVLISLDTLRADHLGSYGYRRPTSPWMDRYADRSYRFASAVSAAPWTLPSHRALLTGLYPISHGGLKPESLGETLWHAGYRTDAWTGGGVMDFRFNLSKGFDSYRIQDWIRDPGELDRAIRASTGRKRFLFLHTYEPHDPYVSTEFVEDMPPGRLDGYFDNKMWNQMHKDLTEEEKAYVEALYDGDIAFTDRQLKDLFDRLESSGVWDRAVVIITSDHGEQFWEHNTWRHGQSLYDHQLMVPLILHVPKRLRRELDLSERSMVIEQQVRLIDVVPTVHELLGLPLVRPVQGRSLVPLLRGETLPDVDALAEHLNVREKKAKAVRFRGHKYIRSLVGPDPTNRDEFHELYEVSRDPGEQANLASEREELVARFRLRLDEIVGAAWQEEGTRLEDLKLDSALKKQLEALGYLGN